MTKHDQEPRMCRKCFQSNGSNESDSCGNWPEPLSPTKVRQSPEHNGGIAAGCDPCDDPRDGLPRIDQSPSRAIRRWLSRIQPARIRRAISASLIRRGCRPRCRQSAASPSVGDHGRLRRLSFRSGRIHRDVDDLWLVGHRQQRAERHGHESQSRGRRLARLAATPPTGQPMPARHETWSARHPIAPGPVRAPGAHVPAGSSRRRGGIAVPWNSQPFTQPGEACLVESV